MSFDHDSLVDRVLTKFTGNGWLAFKQVANRIGGPSRYADAVAVNLYRSQGQAFHGFEVKVSKPDLRKELKEPDKSDEIARHCERWWLVAPDDVVEGEIIPDAWGVLVPHGAGLRVKKDAKDTPAEAPDKAFLLALLARAFERFERGFDRDKFKEITKAKIQAENAVKSHLEEREKRVEEAEQRIHDFETALGIRVQWNRKLAEQAQAIAHFIRNQEHRPRNLRYDADKYRGLADQVERTADAVEALREAGVGEDGDA